MNKKYSKAHIALSKYYQVSDVLSNPEYYFGSNYKTLLNFWLFLDKLSEKDETRIFSRFSYGNDQVTFRASGNASENGLQFRTSFGVSAFRNVNHKDAKVMISHEIIGMNILLSEGFKLRYIPLLENYE